MKASDTWHCFGMLEHEVKLMGCKSMKTWDEKDFTTEKIISFLIHDLWGF